MYTDDYIFFFFLSHPFTRLLSFKRRNSQEREENEREKKILTTRFQGIRFLEIVSRMFSIFSSRECILLPLG